MMAAPEYYIFTGSRDVGRVPLHVTHVRIAKALKFVPARAFWGHPNIEEVICHDGVERVNEFAFYNSPFLRRVIMPGVKVLEQCAFNLCTSLTYIECGKLEVIGQSAFASCTSLDSSIDLPSIRIVQKSAFCDCKNLINAKFGKDLESIGDSVFYYCRSLERITLPLKDDVMTSDRIFQYCERLNHVDLVEGGVLNETTAALQMEEWKNDMNGEIDAINQGLACAPTGNEVNDEGKARAIRAWITSLLRKIVHYKAEHRRYLNVASAALQPALPNDIVLKNIFPFIELPSFTFEGEH